MKTARKNSISPDRSLSTHNGFSLISDEKLLELYATMLRCRMLHERMRELTRGNRAAMPIAAVNEKIAAIAGALIDLQSRDILAPSRDGLGPCFMKGLPLAAVLAKAMGASSKRAPSYASFNVISPALRFAKQLERTIAAAARENRGRDRKVAVIFCGGLDASANDLESAMKLAIRKRLPMVFVCWSDSAEGGHAELAQARGLAGVAVDGDDAVAMYRVATEAIAHARRGSGPTVIDCRPWPAKGRVARSGASDPVRNMELYLRQKNLWSRKFKVQVIADFERKLDEAMR